MPIDTVQGLPSLLIISLYLYGTLHSDFLSVLGKYSFGQHWIFIFLVLNLNPRHKSVGLPSFARLQPYCIPTLQNLPSIFLQTTFTGSIALREDDHHKNCYLDLQNKVGGYIGETILGPCLKQHFQIPASLKPCFHRLRG